MNIRHLPLAVPLLLIACGSEPTAPPESAAGNRAVYGTAAAAPVPTMSCTVRPVGAQFDVAIDWSRLSVTRIVVYDPRLGGGGAHTVTLAHPQRKGSLVVRLAFQPFTAGFGDRNAYAETACVFVSS